MPSIAHLIHAYGLLVVAGTIGLEGIGFPVPGETALIVASVISGTKHELNIVAVILTAAGASIVGRTLGYLIGRYFGYWLLLRYGCYIWINEARIGAFDAPQGAELVDGSDEFAQVLIHGVAPAFCRKPSHACARLRWQVKEFSFLANEYK